MRKAIIICAVVAAVVGIVCYVYFDYRRDRELANPRFYSGNGRLEATEIYVSSKLAGRVEKVFVKEGDLVRVGEKLVQMQTSVLEAQKAAAIANIKVKQGELAMARAVVRQKESSLDGAEKSYKRQKELLPANATSQRNFDDAETVYRSALADLEYARASVITAEGQIEVQKAELARIEADISDSTLYATRDGRIQYLLAHEGEVLSAGGRVMNLVDLTDAYITFFLPTAVAGRVQMGAEVKIVFDAAPKHAFNAKVTFIDPVAQFTPKTVETQAEREKLMFRIKANLDADKLRKYIKDVKTGIPGVAWVKIDPNADWADAPLPVLRGGN